jgi:SAM-dependent methyltransferase
MGASVVGVDLTESYVNVGIMLNTLCGISEDAVSLRVGSALDLKAATGEADFDKAYLLHVGMNIPDKTMLMKSIAQQLKPGGMVGVYDVMQSAERVDEPFEYPLPWASTEAHNACASPETYRAAFAAAGLELTLEENMRDFALDSFKQIKTMRDKAVEDGTPPSPVSLQLLMGDKFPIKMQNIVQGIVSERFSPVIMIGRKAES